MANDDFRERPESELANLSDDDLIEYVRRAREAGAIDAMNLALAVLVHGYFPILVRRATLKLPGWADPEEVAAEAMIGALKSKFDGETTVSFKAWINRILQRRIADLLRKGRLDTTPLLTGDEDAEKEWGEVPSVEFEGITTDVQRAIAEVFESRSETHRDVIELYVFGGHSAREVADATGESEANVNQIGSRFRRDLRALLEDSDTQD